MKSSMFSKWLSMAVLMQSVAEDVAPSGGSASVNSNSETSAPSEDHPLVAAIKANFDNLVDVIDTKFHFKKTADTEAEGGVIIPGTKRPTVELKMPVPSVEGIIDILQKGGKGLELLQEAIRDVVTARARDIINDKEDITQENFPMEELGWDKIANLPKAERRGGGIPKETWEEFAKDYIAIMPAVTQKSKDKVELAAKVFLNKFASVKTDKKVLALLKAQLALYTSNSPNAGDFVECIDFLDKKAQTLIDTDSSNLLEAL